MRDDVIVGRVANPQALVLTAGILTEHHQALVGVLVGLEPAEQRKRVTGDARLVVAPEVLAGCVVQSQRPAVRSCRRFRRTVSYGQNPAVTAGVPEPVLRSVERPEREQAAAQRVAAVELRAAYGLDLSHDLPQDW
jgi:hypothetical protein